MNMPVLLVLAMLAVAGCGGDDALQVARAGPPAADELCAQIARDHDGEVAAAYDTTVAAVREHVADPHDAHGDPSSAPVPAPYVFPAGWAVKAPDDPAVVCYVDAVIPVPLPPGAPAADRGMFMAAAGAESFLVTAGPRATMELAPLRTPQQRAGRANALDCAGDSRSVTLMVDHDGTVPGAPTPAEAAHRLLDEHDFPRERYTERMATSSLGRPLLELLSADGRVVAYVGFDRWPGDTWMGANLTSCQNVWNGGG